MFLTRAAASPSWSSEDEQGADHADIRREQEGGGKPVCVAETVALLVYAQQHHLAQFSYWDLNRDRACDPSVPHNWADGSCSSVSQQPYDFTKITAQYHG